jgi:uncharacterized protein
MATAEPDFTDEAGDGAPDDESGGMRRCLVSRERLPRERMLRFAVSPEGGVVADLAERLPGRGYWLSARADMVEMAVRRGGFARAARRPVAVAPDLLARLRGGLEQRIGETLGLARRAGQVVFGFVRAQEWVRAGRAGLIVSASDGSAEERARLLAGRPLRVLQPLDAARLGAAMGRDHVVHVAVAPGRLAERLVVDAERLAGLTSPAGEMESGRDDR